MTYKVCLAVAGRQVARDLAPEPWTANQEVARSSRARRTISKSFK
jgi:hypothetical protein